MGSRVFISYASEQDEVARHLELSLKGEGHGVFHARTSLPPGESFDDRIRAAIDNSDVFVFLVSPESVAPGRYTLTELKFAEQKWDHPAGHVLPVVLAPVPKDAMPPYLKSVTWLQPKGNVTAEVAAAVARLTAPWWRQLFRDRWKPAVAVLALSMGAVAWFVVPERLAQREQQQRADGIVAQGLQALEAGEYRRAWQLLEQATSIAPGSRSTLEAQERVAMTMLRDTGIDYFGGSSRAFAELVDQVLPVVSRGAAVARGQRLADLLAHQGWADYLRERAGIGGLEAARYYRRALEVEPGNVYGHAMWGFEILRQRGSRTAVAEARPHFAAAVESGRERQYVRDLHVAGLLQSYSNAWINDPERHREVLRVASAMRSGGEKRPDAWGTGSLRNLVWAIYHFEVVMSDGPWPVLGALPPVEHLETFRWLFPDNDLAEGRGAPSLFNYLTVLAPLQEQAGDRAGALASYRRLLAEFSAKGYNASRAVKTAREAEMAIKRLANQG